MLRRLSLIIGPPGMAYHQPFSFPFALIIPFDYPLRHFFTGHLKKMILGLPVAIEESQASEGGGGPAIRDAPSLDSQTLPVELESQEPAVPFFTPASQIAEEPQAQQPVLLLDLANRSIRIALWELRSAYWAIQGVLLHRLLPS